MTAECGEMVLLYAFASGMMLSACGSLYNRALFGTLEASPSKIARPGRDYERLTDLIRRGPQPTRPCEGSR